MKTFPAPGSVASVLSVIAIVVILCGHGFAQEKAQPAKKAPVLTEQQVLTLKNGLQAVEIASLKVRALTSEQTAANSEYERARAALQQLIATSTPAGYEISNDYKLVPKAAEPKKAEPKPADKPAAEKE